MTLSLQVTTADSASMHGFFFFFSENSNGHAWLRLYAKNYLGEETPELCVHMPLRLAEMIEEAFHAYEDWESGQEGPTRGPCLTGFLSSAEPHPPGARGRGRITQRRVK